MTTREAQRNEFFRKYERQLLTIAIARNWNRKGFELKEWERHLLPDGYACPERETYDSLSVVS